MVRDTDVMPYVKHAAYGHFRADIHNPQVQRSHVGHSSAIFIFFDYDWRGFDTELASGFHGVQGPWQQRTIARQRREPAELGRCWGETSVREEPPRCRRVFQPSSVLEQVPSLQVSQVFDAASARPVRATLVVARAGTGKVQAANSGRHTAIPALRRAYIITGQCRSAALTLAYTRNAIRPSRARSSVPGVPRTKRPLP